MFGVAYAVHPKWHNLHKAARTDWRQVVNARVNTDGQVDIAMVGKYVQIRDSYISLNEALVHAGLKTRTRVRVLDSPIDLSR